MRRALALATALVVLGMRVAFAAGLAGLVGLVWIFWDKRSYDPEMLGWAR